MKITAKQVYVIEIGVVLCMVLVILFAPKSQRLWLFGFGLLGLGGNSLIHWVINQSPVEFTFPSLGKTGLGLENFKASSYIIVIALGLAALLFAVGALFGTIHGVNNLTLKLQSYPVGAFLQQLVLQCYVFRRLAVVCGEEKAVLWSAVLFSFLHLPNPALTCVTLFSGWLLTNNFRQYRCIYPLWISHMILGFSFSLALPPFLTGGMQVGMGYINFVIQHLL